MPDVPMGSRKEIHLVAISRWRRVSCTVLRPCRLCEQLFPSTSPGHRMCGSCERKVNDARARASRESDLRVALDFFDEYFDVSMVDRRRRDRETDRRSRKLRQKKCT